ncbi:MAG: 2-hydroxyacid dehydrogenase [Caulobacterales bacterium]|nr:2-hydroxyacid dehydrogenase [Caulobacterales bacterium]
MTRPAILIVQPHLHPLRGFLDSTYDTYGLWEGPPAEAAAQIGALVVDGAYPLDRRLVEQLPNLGLIACFTAGHDGIDIRWCREKGLAVTHAPAVNHEDVADHALALILAARREIIRGDRELRAGGWTPDSRILTGSLKGQRVGIVGMGAIGQAVAVRCEALRMTVSWWGPRAKPDLPQERADSLVDLARDSDILVIAARADDSNRGLISQEVIQALGSQGLLVNVARGQIVDEAAMIAALRAGRLGQAALDVFETEPTDPTRWVDVPNTVLTPHTAGATREAVQAMVMLLIQNLAAHFAGKPLATPLTE